MAARASPVVGLTDVSVSPPGSASQSSGPVQAPVFTAFNPSFSRMDEDADTTDIARPPSDHISRGHALRRVMIGKRGRYTGAVVFQADWTVDADSVARSARSRVAVDRSRVAHESRVRLRSRRGDVTRTTHVRRQDLAVHGPIGRPG